MRTLTWPWVARVTHDALREQLRLATARVAWLEDDLRRERLAVIAARREISETVAQYAGLTQTIQQMAASLQAAHAPLPPIVRTKDAVVEAILQRAGPRSDIRMALSSYAMQQRRAKVDDDTIIQHILIWDTPDENDADAGLPE